MYELWSWTAWVGTLPPPLPEQAAWTPLILVPLWVITAPVSQDCSEGRVNASDMLRTVHTGGIHYGMICWLYMHYLLYNVYYEVGYCHYPFHRWENRLGEITNLHKATWLVRGNERIKKLESPE